MTGYDGELEKNYHFQKQLQSQINRLQYTITC